MSKAWLYARVSTAKCGCTACGKKFLSADDVAECPACGETGKKVERSQDPQNQIRILRQWMHGLGHEVVAEYVDRASGKTSDREQFNKMMTDLRARPKTAPRVLIGFWALDRLSREGVFETLQHLRNITNARADWKSYTEQYLDSTGLFKDAIIAIMAALAKQQRLRISENTRAGLQRAAVMGTRSGKPIGRPNIIDIKRAQSVYSKTKSYRATAKALGVSPNAIKYALKGRPAPKLPDVTWSDPIWGVIEDGTFIERQGGPIVVRYDQESGIPYCINHQGQVAACAELHEAVN
jgi:DNA invertase Pin-like site-specific DNA recombinase